MQLRRLVPEAEGYTSMESPGRGTVMNLEEKRELRLQISQMLADAGLNQGTLKEMVIDTINAKVDRAVDQCFNRLNAETSSGNFVSEYVHKLINQTLWTERAIKDAVFDAIKNKVVRVVLTDCEFERGQDA